MKIGTHIAADASGEELCFLKQIGISHVRVHFAADETDEALLRRAKERFEGFGLRIESVVQLLYQAPEIAFGLPGREDKLERLAEFIRAMGRVGLPVLDYDFFLYAPLPATGETTTRGAKTRCFDLEKAKAYPPVVAVSPTEGEMWENYRRMMEVILPAAESAGVKLALHPDDPPVERLLGVPRIFRNMDGYIRAMEEFSSPAWGVLFCAGTWAEGGETMGAGMSEAIRFFAERGKLFTVHFRNVTGSLPYFSETFLDNGCASMKVVAEALLEANFDGLVIPDHFPSIGGEENHHSALAHSIGYMQALLQ